MYIASKNFSFNIPVVITKQGKRFVAYTPALDISTSGKSEKEVKVRFEEMASIFFEEITEAGTTKDVLTELGWKKEQKNGRHLRWSRQNLLVCSFPF